VYTILVCYRNNIIFYTIFRLLVDNCRTIENDEMSAFYYVRVRCRDAITALYKNISYTPRMYMCNTVCIIRCTFIFYIRFVTTISIRTIISFLCTEITDLAWIVTVYIYLLSSMYLVWNSKNVKRHFMRPISNPIARWTYYKLCIIYDCHIFFVVIYIPKIIRNLTRPYP